VEMSVDLWMIGNVAIHLRQGYGGQDVKVLPVPIFNVWNREVLGVGVQLALCAWMFIEITFLTWFTGLTGFY
jgi:hypothetical protein